MQWHHLACAAGKLPDELRAALAEYPGEVPDRAELDATMAQAATKAAAKPAAHPFVDQAPTGRAGACSAASRSRRARSGSPSSASSRSAASRPAARATSTPAASSRTSRPAAASLDELLEGLRANSRLSEAELDGVIADIEQSGADA